jgi:DNA-binding MurR/RpiR family transcriptional regulator
MHRFCSKCTKIKFSGYQSMQRDIRQENRMNTLTMSERQKMYLKFLKNTYQETKTKILTPQQIELLFIKM